MARGFCAVVGALLVGQATAFFGSPSAFMTGTMSPGLRTPGATSALGREARTYRRLSTAKSGAASTVMMPIGVPKVAYRVPGAPTADWVDIYNRLYRERIIFLGQEIDDELANQIIGVLLYLDSEDSTKPIYLYVNCPGGSVIAGLALFDTMQHIRSEVVTINVGLAASMASFILAAGAKVEATQIMHIRDNIVRMYAMMTGQTQEQITIDLDRDNFMSAQAAADYGLVDNVIKLSKK
ncbi:ATP-dependent Clp protease, proteolytic subunit [Ectocarpus siliculosus]|uniref:ATP-dependent Clp protease proteolytic subunit n=1 Tax=Ectocarpus siliculosus TaxID=2880 RepID=D7FX14_ECTSI|nr:ATP-dependent Clp protease, proteolytic subunit [Ectocarpus siliculosus]|eukprot:CBJ26347.1 ATP-dependent Clp protease, proteolytic subunit [Ectocarpus siliculosus]